MRNNKFWIAVIAGTVVYFFLGWIFYGMLLRDFMHSNAGSATGVDRAISEWGSLVYVVLILGNLVWAYFITTLLGSWSSITTASAGAMRAASAAFLMSLSYDFTMFATTHLMKKWAVATDVITWTVINIIAGAIIGWILGMGKKTEAS